MYESVTASGRLKSTVVILCFIPTQTEAKVPDRVVVQSEQSRFMMAEDLMTVAT